MIAACGGDETMPDFSGTALLPPFRLSGEK